MAQDKINTQRKSGGIHGIFTWLLLLATIFLFLGIVGTGAILFLENYYRNRIYPGVIIGNMDMSGRTLDEAQALIDARYEEISKNGITFFYDQKKVNVPMEVFGNDPDLSRTIISFDTKKTVQDAYWYGRDSKFLYNVASKIYSLISKKRIPMGYAMNEAQVSSILKNGFKEMEDPGRDAFLQITGDTVQVLQEEEGDVFDYEKGISELKNNLSLMKADSIELSMIHTYPSITMGEAKAAIPLVEEIMQTSTPELIYDGFSWKIKRSQVNDWMEFTLVNAGVGKGSKDIGIRFNRDRIMAFLEGISDKIAIDPVDARFELIDGKVSKFQFSKNGRKINFELTYNKINKEYFQSGNSSIGLVVDSVPPAVSTEDINNLGIKEQIGAGITSFAGSPKNRRLNIANGTKLLNGILIKPGEEFSLINALKPFDSTNGFLQELVIKGDRTIPEYGGGLCQIATTLFRATLNAGLPITERKSHTYRVSYYEPPAGIDATIYDPSPDFKFINDTPGYILLMAEIDGDNLKFSFYGTSDGRKSQISPETPKIFNITDPGEPRYIDSDELPPGEKKLVEKPHKGADTSFDYIVTYSDGTVKKTTYTSHYVAWKETWLVGKVATSTVEVSPDSGTLNLN